MEFSRSINRMLHDEHMAVISLLGRFGGYLRDHPGGRPPAPEDRSGDGILREIASAMENEVTAHFAFEEAALFPLLRDAGEGELPAALSEEHAAILPVGRRVAELARGAIATGFTDDGWAEFRRLGSVLASELAAHAEKEEIGFLPVLEDMLGPDEDSKLAADYAARR